MKAKKLIATGIATSMLLLALTGCGAGGNSGKSAKDTDKGSVYFLNFKSELSSEWEEVAGTFTKETGIDMKVVTAGSGTYEQTLKSELSKKEMPTLFNVNGPIGYQTWKDYCADLKDSKLYEWLTDKDMAITDGDGVYGIPYAVEGYGIIYNDAIMKKYFALPDKAVDISDTNKDFKSETIGCSIGLTISKLSDKPCNDKIIANLKAIIAGKMTLFQKAVGTDKELKFEWNKDEIWFDWFDNVIPNEKLGIYISLFKALYKVAEKAVRVNTKDKPVDNEKFAMRTFLNRIGLSGIEYKPLRKELMRNLSGDGAFRYGRPERYK